MSEVNKIADGKVELKVVLDGERWKNAQDKSFNKLAKEIEIRGFRKGQAPKNMIRQRLSEGAILAQAAEDITNDVFREELEANDITLIDRATLDIKEIDADHVTFVFTCPVKPDVTLGEYKNLGYAPKEAVVDDEEVEKQIEMVREQRADLEIKEEDGIVEDGDTVVIDYEGLKDGVPFEGGKADNHELVIGSHTFIPGFEEGLIGMKSEEAKDLELTFPEDYHAEELKGAKVVFKVVVHEIKRKVLPEVDEEFVKELAIKDVNTADELRTYIRETLLDRKKRQNEEDATNALLDKVCDAAKVDIPEIMINDEIDDMEKEMDRDFSAQGFSLDQYLKITGLDKSKFRDNLRIDAEKRVKLRLVLEEIARQENVEISDEEVKKEIEDEAQKYGMKSEDIERIVDKRLIVNDLKMRKALDILKA